MAKKLNLYRGAIVVGAILCLPSFAIFLWFVSFSVDGDPIIWVPAVAGSVAWATLFYLAYARYRSPELATSPFLAILVLAGAGVAAVFAVLVARLFGSLAVVPLICAPVAFAALLLIGGLRRRKTIHEVPPITEGKITSHFKRTNADA